MSLIDEAYADLDLHEVVYRLPSEPAVKALKKMIVKPEDIFLLLDFKEGKTASNFPEVKDHINNIIANMEVSEIGNIEEEKHPALFSWLNSKNKDRLKTYGAEYLSIKLLFNITDPEDTKTWDVILERVLKESTVNDAYLGRVLDKVDSDHLSVIIETVLLDKRPEVRASILKVGGSNKRYITELQTLVGLKAYAKLSNEVDAEGVKPKHAVNMLDWNLLGKLKAAERFEVIKNYLYNYPEYKKLVIFKNAPTFEEFQTAIFPVSLTLNEEYNKVLDNYKNITESEPVKSEEQSEDEEDSLLTTPPALPAITAPVITKVDQLNPEDWYFQDDLFEEDEIEAFTFIRKSTWDADSKLDDNWTANEVEFLENHIKNSGIQVERFASCIYQCDGNIVDDAKKYLKSKGFIRKVCIKN